MKKLLIILVFSFVCCSPKITQNANLTSTDKKDYSTKYSSSKKEILSENERKFISRKLLIGFQKK